MEGGAIELGWLNLVLRYAAFGVMIGKDANMLCGEKSQMVCNIRRMWKALRKVLNQWARQQLILSYILPKRVIRSHQVHENSRHAHGIEISLQSTAFSPPMFELPHYFLLLELTFLPAPTFILLPGANPCPPLSPLISPGKASISHSSLFALLASSLPFSSTCLAYSF